MIEHLRRSLQKQMDTANVSRRPLDDGTSRDDATFSVMVNTVDLEAPYQRGTALRDLFVRWITERGWTIDSILENGYWDVIKLEFECFRILGVPFRQSDPPPVPEPMRPAPRRQISLRGV